MDNQNNDERKSINSFLGIGNGLSNPYLNNNSNNEVPKKEENTIDNVDNITVTMPSNNDSSMISNTMNNKEAPSVPNFSQNNSTTYKDSVNTYQNSMVSNNGIQNNQVLNNTLSQYQENTTSDIPASDEKNIYDDMENESLVADTENVVEEPKETKEPSSLVFLIMAIVGTVGIFLNGLFAILCVISLIGSIVMITKKAKLSVVSLIVSILGIVVYGVLILIATFAMSNIINSTKATAFKDTAHQFITGAYQKVLINKKVSCGENSKKKIKTNLPDLENGGIFSPFGGTYDANASFIVIEASGTEESCKYKKYIYLTDGTYSIGTETNPVLETEIDMYEVNKK